jgi:N-carbamoylputrescine amidase
MNHKDPFNLALVQMRCVAEAADNLGHACEMLRDAKRQGATIACLPELFRTPYFCQTENHANFDLAEPIPGPTTEALAAVAKETAMTIVGSIFERRTAGIYHNTAVVLDSDGRLAGIYRKMHIPDDPLYYEKFYFTPGDTGFVAVPTRFARVGPLVCWDQWYPEAARLTALAGAEVLFYPTAIGWHPSERSTHGPSQLAAWQVMHRAHAIANGVHVAAVNRVGHEGPAGGGLDFWGASLVCDPFGVVLAEAPSDEEATLVVECSRARQEEVRRSWPFLRDRRIDAYAPITTRLLDT